MITKYTGSEKGSDVADTTPKGVYIPSDLEKKGLKLIGFSEASHDGDGVLVGIPHDSAYRHLHIVAHVETYVDIPDNAFIGLAYLTTPDIGLKCQWSGVQYTRPETAVSWLLINDNAHLIDANIPTQHTAAQYNVNLTRTSSTVNWWNYTATVSASSGIFRSIGGVISVGFDYFNSFRIQRSTGQTTGLFVKGSYIAVYGSKY